MNTHPEEQPSADVVVAILVALVVGLICYGVFLLSTE
jgi:hypothetical protein